MSPEDLISALTPDACATHAARLLDWYRHNARTLPWRIPPGGEKPDPYRIWLSEVMLQQTTVAAATGYYRRFLSLWPTVADLAAAPSEDVMAAWAGLGYYARARNLHACAKVVAGQYKGQFPDTEEALLQLPGIGIYTAAAITAIAFHRRAVVVDGNVERVMARLFAVTAPLPGAKPLLRDAAARLTPEQQPGDYAQAVMDLGATLCTPRNPACVLCPWMGSCMGCRTGLAESLPARGEAKERPVRHGLAFWLLRKDGAVLLRRRPDSGLLGGMMEIPSTPWEEDRCWTLEDAVRYSPAEGYQWRLLPSGISHVFTHFRLDIQVAVAHVRNPALALGLWCPLDTLEAQGLPTVMKKIMRHALRRAYQEE